MAGNRFGPRGWTPERINSLSGKTYLITGANAGAGFEAARVLISKGAAVVMLNRNAEKSEAAVSALRQEFGTDTDIRYILMDLAAFSSVRTAAGDVLAQVPQIDALICNAAIAQVARQQITVDGFESQLGVNHLGHFLLSGLLFDRIEKSRGRIVVVGSNGYKMGLRRIKFEDLNFDKNYTGWNSYAQSKLAQMMFAYELQRRAHAAGKSVQVHVCHPGASRTSLLRDDAGLGTRILWTLLAPFAQSAEKGSWPEVMCATEDGLKPEMYHGPTRFEVVGPIDERPVEEIALDRDAATKLWALSENATSISWEL